MSRKKVLDMYVLPRKRTQGSSCSVPFTYRRVTTSQPVMTLPTEARSSEDRQRLAKRAFKLPLRKL